MTVRAGRDDGPAILFREDTTRPRRLVKVPL
jgi:hypothetical protein